MAKKLITSLLEPDTIDNVVGQSHLIGKDKIITKMIERKQIFSMILYGPTGVGKTWLAKSIAKSIGFKYYIFNPTVDHKSKLISLLQECINNNKDKQKIIIIDEIHRLNKDKQDILLSYLEQDEIILIGTTNDNPYFVINPAIRSRCQIFQLTKVSYQEMFDALIKIIEKYKLNFPIQHLDLIINGVYGDIRSAINLIDIISDLYQDNEITRELIVNALPQANICASYYGDDFYDVQSAFHKSMRGSDINASLHYLARLIKIGDLSSIKRRILATTYEDIGLANPSLLSRVVLAMQTVDILGLPEAKQVLATTVVDICLSPKSNSTINAIELALADIDNGFGNYKVPNHLRDGHYKSANKLGVVGYKYPHDFPNHWVKQQYLPEQMQNKKYYYPCNNISENKLNKLYNEWRLNNKH